MRRYSVISLMLCIFLASCGNKSEVEKSVEGIPMQLKVERFDKAFFETPPADFQKLKRQYPYFFPGTDDKVWLDKMQDPQWRELYGEVEKKFPDFNPQAQKIEELFRHIKYYFPETRTPKIVTVISEMDYNNKVIYADSLVIISLELYLGKNHRFYEYPEYLKYNFEPVQIAPDIVSAFIRPKILPPDNSFMSQMIAAGKELYIKDMLLADYTDDQKIGYKPQQLQWCRENEGYIWSYFIENKLLYDTDPKLASRFLNPAPFSKFYLEIDNESPGRVGAWTGWQIVRSYMDKNKVAIGQLLKTDAKEIFERSRYKPKKDAE